jgi:hypothetical protein
MPCLSVLVVQEDKAWLDWLPKFVNIKFSKSKLLKLMEKYNGKKI